MLILGIDTSTNASSIAIFSDSRILALDFIDTDTPQSEMLMTRIDYMLSTQKIEKTALKAVCVCIGPGSFTGIRVGIATAKAICIALQIPLVAFNSLELLATNVYTTPENILTIIDARMGQAYTAVFDSSLKPLALPTTTTYADIIDLIDKYHPICLGDTHLIPTGVCAKTALPHQNIKSATAMCSLLVHRDITPIYDAGYISELEPFYIRPATAQVSIP